MPVQLGAPKEHGFDEPLGLLSDCHRRIENFLDLMIRVVNGSGDGQMGQQQRQALESALRYFEFAAPRHTHDEEESLFPRMRASADPAVREAMARLDALEADHRRAEAIHAQVADLCGQWLRNAALPPVQIEHLKQMLTALREIYTRHIAVEDQQVFPLAARVLSDDELVQVGREMAGRRGLQPPPTTGAETTTRR